MSHPIVEYFGVWNPATQRRNGYDEDYKTVQGRENIKSLIQKDIVLLLNHMPMETYQKAIEAHPADFEKSTTDDQAQFGATENRPCKSGMSKVHRLNCGQLIYCDALNVCGRNCYQALQANVQFYCLLCFRGQTARDAKNDPKWWHDLLLPKYHEPEK